MLSLGAARENGGDALLAAEAEVAFPVRRPHRHREATRYLDRDGVDRARGEDPRGEVPGSRGVGLDLNQLPRRRRQRSLSRLHKRAQAAGAKRPGAGHGSAKAGGDAARRGEGIGLLHPASLALGFLQPPLRLVVLEPTVKVVLLVGARAQRLQRLSRNLHRVHRVAALADGASGAAGCGAGSRDGAGCDGAGLRCGGHPARSRVLGGAAEKPLDPGPGCLADERTGGAARHVLHVELVARSLLARGGGLVQCGCVGVLGGELVAFVLRTE